MRACSGLFGLFTCFFLFGKEHVAVEVLRTQESTVLGPLLQVARACGGELTQRACRLPPLRSICTNTPDQIDGSTGEEPLVSAQGTHPASEQSFRSNGSHIQLRQTAGTPPAELVNEELVVPDVIDGVLAGWKDNSSSIRNFPFLSLDATEHDATIYPPIIPSEQEEAAVLARAHMSISVRNNLSHLLEDVTITVHSESGWIEGAAAAVWIPPGAPSPVAQASVHMKFAVVFAPFLAGVLLMVAVMSWWHVSPTADTGRCMETLIENLNMNPPEQLSTAYLKEAKDMLELMIGGKFMEMSGDDLGIVSHLYQVVVLELSSSRRRSSGRAASAIRQS